MGDFRWEQIWRNENTLTNVKPCNLCEFADGKKKRFGDYGSTLHVYFGGSELPCQIGANRNRFCSRTRIIQGIVTCDHQHEFERDSVSFLCPAKFKIEMKFRTVNWSSVRLSNNPIFINFKFSFSLVDKFWR